MRRATSFWSTGFRAAKLRVAPRLGVLAGLASTLALTGCIGYTTYPPADWQLASEDISGPPADEIMTESLVWAIEKYPPAGSGPAVINLPEGVHDRAYRVIGHRVDDRTAIEVRPMAPGLDVAPTYHVTRLWVRSDRAEVDVLRPVEELGPSPTGNPIVQAVTVHLKGGISAWRVVRTRPWVIGADAIPEPHEIGAFPEDG